MFEDLRWLIKLQKVDREIYRITSEQRNSEKKIDNYNLDIEEAILKKYKTLKKLDKRVGIKDKTVLDIEDQKRLLEQKNTDLLNEKKTKKEHIKREIKKLEEAVKVFSIKVTKMEEDIAGINEQIAGHDTEVASLQEEILKEEKNIASLKKKNAKELKKLEKEKDEICSHIRKYFLMHYQRIMNIRNGVAITYVNQKGLCNGCNIHVPYQRQQQINKMNDYNICEGCGRILVVKETLEDGVD